MINFTGLQNQLTIIKMEVVVSFEDNKSIIDLFSSTILEMA